MGLLWGDKHDGSGEIYLSSWINWGVGSLGLARVFRLERETLNMAGTSYTEL